MANFTKVDMTTWHKEASTDGIITTITLSITGGDPITLKHSQFCVGNAKMTMGGKQDIVRTPLSELFDVFGNVDVNAKVISVQYTPAYEKPIETIDELDEALKEKYGMIHVPSRTVVVVECISVPIEK